MFIYYPWIFQKDFKWKKYPNLRESYWVTIWEFLIISYSRIQDNIQMQIRMKLNKTLFSTAEYSSLREFFSHIVRKESDQIVFKKTKS